MRILIGVWPELANAVLSKGGTKSHLEQLRLPEARMIVDQLADFIIESGRQRSFEVIVDCSKGIGPMVQNAMFDRVNDVDMLSRMHLTRSGCYEAELTLVYIRGEPIAIDVIELLHSWHLMPALPEELFAFAMQHAAVQLEFPIACVDGEWSDSSGHLRFAVLTNEKDRRCLDSHPASQPLPAETRFLAVRKRSAAVFELTQRAEQSSEDLHASEIAVVVQDGPVALPDPYGELLDLDPEAVEFGDYKELVSEVSRAIDSMVPVPDEEPPRHLSQDDDEPTGDDHAVRAFVSIDDGDDSARDCLDPDAPVEDDDQPTEGDLDVYLDGIVPETGTGIRIEDDEAPEEITLKSETVMLNIDFGATLIELLDAGEYELVVPDVNEQNFPLNGEGTQMMQLEVVGVSHEVDTKTLLELLRSAGYQLARAEHILTLGAKFKELQTKHPIVALGSIWVNKFDESGYAIELGFNRQGRRVNLVWLESRWKPTYRFLCFKAGNGASDSPGS
ncbi:MAG: hypothetical protein ABIG66_05530 [Candidatus Kerfeldbacteria bacterium]